MKNRYCFICDKPILYRFWVCPECKLEYRLGDFKDWPVWAKKLNNEAQKEWRNAVARDKDERSFSDYDPVKLREMVDIASYNAWATPKA